MSYTRKGTLIGIAPILFERLIEDASNRIETGESEPRMTREERIAEAETKIYVDNDGKMAEPAKNVKKCLVQGSQMLEQKRGRRSLWPYILATAFFGTTFLYFVDETDPRLIKTERDFIHEETARRPKGKRGAPVQVFRPALKEGWLLPFELTIYDDTIPPKQVKAAFEYAGLVVGLGGHRPEYGRFRVEWEEEEKNE